MLFPNCHAELVSASVTLLALYSLCLALPFKIPKQVRDDKKGAQFLFPRHAELVSASVMHIPLTFPKIRFFNYIIGVKSMHFHLLQSVFRMFDIFFAINNMSEKLFL